MEETEGCAASVVSSRQWAQEKGKGKRGVLKIEVGRGAQVVEEGSTPAGRFGQNLRWMRSTFIF
ncbi:hypothetical protein CONLIGDRAFT_633836 [Coniochaeta ligniaria NRRL 30616]|uniref:Uncharacterized protein n=1 Tax=Coniochaeta ligniaria NRRL 30616 TaxID=1408157 RepID=A0A1J7JIM0_9PEZI|nr:hypothetical protein CONLIGDRAFT_633836 [Coniochaeta ligniaria NRRL 30616]